MGSDGWGVLALVRAEVTLLLASTRELLFGERLILGGRERPLP